MTLDETLAQLEQTREQSCLTRAPASCGTTLWGD
jgi:hypothetical protein